ncbi:CsoS2 family carboxysome shell protein [Thioalkalivibrio sp. ALJ16]|uniref:CsoS2 family carboxysome shell protein n=1 Tax=Thioalkalivibrio sp. ALJ16 TaxID=1158762 RepID=UPI000379CF71|nr:CsoS2 family carboxysome shell protein [Thioalkalivibrio sp. ALJ16]
MSRNGKAAVKSTGQTKGNNRSAAAAQQARQAKAAPAPAPQAREPEQHISESSSPVSFETRDTTPERRPEPGAHAGASNGRQAALERRQKMARQGKKAVGRTNTRARVSGGMARAGADRSRQLEALAQSQNVEVDCSHMSGREICRLRRQALATDGKKAMAPEPRREDRLKGREPVQSAPTEASKDCGCGCKGEKAGQEPVHAATPEQAVVDTGLDQLCDKVESGGEAAGPHPMISEVRAICMARRDAMAQNGKQALRRRFKGGQARGALPQEGAWKAAKRKGMSTREVARQRREELCKLGRGSSEPGRPCGRPRPGDADAPPKVEEGTTLAGSHVSGTQVERSQNVTGTEAGSCSAITGTEYLGLEHYERYCGVRPAGNPPKVGTSHTTRGQAVSGTEVGRSTRVTGDERGSCETITGTEYLSSEQYEGFCGTRPQGAPARTSVMVTRQGEGVSGTSVGRSPKVTGDESGSCRDITGTEYLNTAASEVPCSTGKPSGAPVKVGVMHTLRGRELTGTEVGRSVHVTGDEYGSCKPVTGTEYLGQEQFQGFCGTRPEPAPAKVQESHTQDDQSVTGIAVGRSAKVTGDEPGSCATLTGTPYYNKSDFGDLCERPGAGGVPKVGVMHTLRGREVSGTQVDSSIRVTGDEYGGCKPITGTEYAGSEHYDAFCGGSRPQAAPEKVTVGRTWNQQLVSGTAVGRSARVTGDEYGACKPVSGTAYIGPDQYDQFCEPRDSEVAGTRVADRHSTPAHPVSGSQPGYDERVTGTERGACQDVSGAPYVGANEFARTCSSAAGSLHPRLRPEGMQVAAPSAPRAAERPMPNGGFSVNTPARAAAERRERVTGTAYGSSGSVTGSINKAMGLVSGTEEFRYSRQEPAVAAAPVEDQPKVGAERVTVNGSSNGVSITGDDWQRGDRVTGTEGFSTRRNATQKGNPRGEGRSAYLNRELERKDVPPSKITGSSGNSDAGSLVTLSGGARG